MATEMEKEEKGNINNNISDWLPEGCVAKILSFTTPLDACTLSLLSKLFYSAAESDVVWDRFLPSFLHSIIPRSSPLLTNSCSKKALFLALSDHPLILDQGKKSFQLDKRSGKICYMIAPTDLCIFWGNTPQYWDWISMPESRFEVAARLVAVCWFEIRGSINTAILSPDTEYAVFLVFKLINAHGFHYLPTELWVGINGDQSITKRVCLDPSLQNTRLHPSFEGLERPTKRTDEWLEIEMGDFFNSGLEDDQVEMRIMETKSNWWKRGFFLQGIEVRPKY